MESLGDKWEEGEAKVEVVENIEFYEEKSSSSESPISYSEDASSPALWKIEQHSDVQDNMDEQVQRLEKEIKSLNNKLKDQNDHLSKLKKQILNLEKSSTSQEQLILDKHKQQTEMIPEIV